VIGLERCISDGPGPRYTCPMEMTTSAWQYLSEYCRNVFGQQDEHLARLMPDAVARGLPDIAVSADVGRLLMILTAMTRGRLAIEVGTLAGYSGIWIARGLHDGGRLITIEREQKHADFAREQFDRAGVGDRVEIRVAPAIEALHKLADELAPGSADVVFLDAEKVEYSEYWRIARPLIAVGGLILADNALGSGSWMIADEHNETRKAADRFNRLVASDDDFEAVAVPLRQGVLIGRRMK
jgi:predicted O-methyltransferase YrrM